VGVGDAEQKPLATRGDTRMGNAATRRILEIAHEPFRFEGDRDVVPQRTVDGRSSFLVKLDDEGGMRFIHLRVWRAKSGLGGLASRFRTSPGFHTWERALALVEAGVPTPRPMVVAERKGEWSCYASEQLDATINLEQVMQQVASWGEQRQVKFARHLGEHFRKLREKKLALAELSPSCFLVRGVPDFDFELYVAEPETATVGGGMDRSQIESRVLFGLPERVVKAFFASMG
jgi:hypothetical protein